jgi:DNA-binding transcriptional ArsR family regulator
MDKINQIKNEFNDVGDLLVALGDKKRQAILLSLLDDNGCIKLRVGELTDVTGLSRPAVSHHLNILKQTGIITCTNAGTKNYYAISHDIPNFKQLKSLINNIDYILGGN